MAPSLSATRQHESRKEGREILMRVEWQKMGDVLVGSHDHQGTLVTIYAAQVEDVRA